MYFSSAVLDRSHHHQKRWLFIPETPARSCKLAGDLLHKLGPPGLTVAAQEHIIPPAGDSRRRTSTEIKFLIDLPLFRRREKRKLGWKGIRQTR
jgi:hypothetical protein